MPVLRACATFPTFMPCEHTWRKWLDFTRPCHNGSLWGKYVCMYVCPVVYCIFVSCVAMWRCLMTGSSFCSSPLQLTKAKELLRVLLSSTVTEEGPTDSKGGSPSHPNSQPLRRKQVHNTASAVTGRMPLPDGTSCSESSESTMASDTESDVSSAHMAAAKVHHSKQRPTSIEANSN